MFDSHPPKSNKVTKIDTNSSMCVLSLEEDQQQTIQGSTTSACTMVLIVLANNSVTRTGVAKNSQEANEKGPNSYESPLTKATSGHPSQRKSSCKTRCSVA